MNKRNSPSLVKLFLVNLFTFGHIYLHLFKLYEHILFANICDLVAFICELVAYVMWYVTYGCLDVLWIKGFAYYFLKL